VSDGMRNVNSVAPLACRLCIELDKERRPVFNDVCRLRVRDQTKQRHIEFWLLDVNRGAKLTSITGPFCQSFCIPVWHQPRASKLIFIR